MATCEIGIAFDGDRRRYRAREVVRGTVSVEVSEAVRCKGLVLERFWRTHGRGNRDRGGMSSRSLAAGVTWEPGRVYEFGFRFKAPSRPITYHGHYLNIDHYVAARADIPWSLDPKAQEDFIVLPGPTDLGGKAKEMVKRFESAPVSTPVLVGGLVLVAVIAPFLLPGFLAFLLIVGIVVAGATVLRNTLAAQKLGSVVLKLGTTTTIMGQSIPVEIRFRPRKPVDLNGITVELRAQERCTSGSGTNRTRHTHSVVSRTVAFTPSQHLHAGEAHVARGVIDIPAEGPASFESRNNVLQWRARLRIDVANWPDWTYTTKLTVVGGLDQRGADSRTLPLDVAAVAAVPVSPAGERSAKRQPIDPLAARPAIPQPGPLPAREFKLQSGVPNVVEEQRLPRLPAPTPIRIGPQSEEIGGTPPAASTPDIAPAGGMPASPVPDPLTLVPSPGSDAALGEDAAILAVFDRLASADRFSGERDRIVEEMKGMDAVVGLDVERIERTYTYDVPADFRGGRTLVGEIAGSNRKLAVRLPDRQNDAVDALAMGSRIRVAGILHEWDDFQNRPVLHAEAYEPAVDG